MEEAVRRKAQEKDTGGLAPFRFHCFYFHL